MRTRVRMEHSTACALHRVGPDRPLASHEQHISLPDRSARNVALTHESPFVNSRK